MESPGLRHFRNGRIYSDPVDALVGEAWAQAVFTDYGWELLDGTKLKNIVEWRSGQKTNEEPEEGGKSAARVQGRHTAQRQNGTRKRASRKI